MKYLVKLFVVTFILSICTYASAEDKITYIDLKYVLNNSKAGKSAQDYLKKTFSDNAKKFTEAINAIKIMSIVIIPTTVALIMESEFLGQEKSRIVIIGSLIYLVSLVIGMITLGSLFGVEGIAYSLILATILKTTLYATFRNRIRTNT